MRQLSVRLTELMTLRNVTSLFGVGFGLLLANRLSEGERKAAGWVAVLSSLAIGIPFGIGFIGRLRAQTAERLPAQASLPFAQERAARPAEARA